MLKTSNTTPAGNAAGFVLSNHPQAPAAAPEKAASAPEAVTPANAPAAKEKPAAAPEKAASAPEGPRSIGELLEAVKRAEVMPERTAAEKGEKAEALVYTRNAYFSAQQGLPILEMDANAMATHAPHAKAREAGRLADALRLVEREFPEFIGRVTLELAPDAPAK